MKFRYLLIFLLSFSNAFVSSVEVEAQELEVTGRVVDASGAPVASVPVQLVPLLGAYEAGLDSLAGRHYTEAVVETKTNERGAYLLRAPEAGMWWVRVAAEGHVAMGRRLMPLLADLEVPTAQLVPAQLTELTILGKQGQALADTLVSATNDQRRRAGEWWLQRFYSLTNEEGKVRIPQPEKASLTVYAHHPEYLAGVLEGMSKSASLTLKGGKLQPIQIQDHQGKPLPDVLVRVGRGRFALGTTNEEGRLAVLTTEQEDQELRITAPDLRSWTGGLRANPGESPKEDVLKLEALVTIEGRVIESVQRDPVPGALVWLGYQAETVVRSDSRGSFRLARSAQSTPWLRAAASGYFSASAQIEEDSSEAPTLILEPSLGLVGRVVDEAGEPLADVTVKVTAIPGRDFGRVARQSGGSVTSDEEGTFHLPRLLAKTSYRLECKLRGYARAEQTFVAPQPGESFELEVVMAKGQNAFGLVVDVEEQPLDGAEVVLYRQEAGQVPWSMQHSMGREGVSTAGRATSGKNGRFTVSDLGPGRYRLEVERSGFAPTTVPGIEISEVDLPEGFDLGTLVMVPGVNLEGRVVDEEGKALVGAEIYAQSRDAQMNFFSRRRNRGEPSAKTDQEGRFVLPDHRRGEVLDLTAVESGYMRENLAGIEVPTEEPVLFTLKKASRLAGRVVTEDGRGVPRVIISVTVEQPGGMWNGHQSRTARAQADGTFVVEELQTGVARLVAQSREHGQGELSGVEIVQGETVEGLVITLRSGATLRGVVLGPGGEPLPGVMVVESNRNQPERAYRDVSMTDGDGRFRLNGLEPGRRTIEARHKAFQEASETLEIKPGENFLEFRLGKGQKVRGQVVDGEGQPLAGAMVRLTGQKEGYQVSDEASTDHEGRFEYENVVDGTYKLVASHPEHASARLPEDFVVAGTAVEGLLLQLEKGAVITGRVLGLEFDDLAQVQIYGSSELGMRLGEVDFEARYRIPGAAPGSWSVVAQVPDGRQAQGQTTVELGASEVELDLEIKKGLTLSGKVLRGEQPLDGAYVQLSGVDVGAYGSSRSNYQGQYRVTGLEEGRYQIQVYGLSSGLTHSEEITLTGDHSHNIVLEGSRVTGRVVEASGGAPLAGVRFSVEPVGNQGDHFTTGRDRARSNSAGLFDLGELSPRRWLVKAQKEGYAQSTAEFEVVRGADPPPLELTLSATEGLWLTVHTPQPLGQFRGAVLLALLDAQDQAVATTVSQMDNEGKVHFATAPRGSWQLLVAGDGLVPVRFPVNVPEDRPEVTLNVGGSLMIQVPGLATQPGVAHAELRAANGEPFIALYRNLVLSRFPFSEDKGAVNHLPPGTWSVQVTAEDGRAWSGSAVVSVGERTQLTLE